MSKSFRIIFLSIISLFIGIVFANHLQDVKGKTENTNLSQPSVKQNNPASTNFLTNLLPDPTPSPTPHTLVGSYYLVDENIDAKLLLNNKGNAPLEVQPTLYNKQG